MRELFGGYFLIGLSLLVALLLTLLPLPNWAVWARPSWILMVLVFWLMVAPHQVGVGTAWFVGLLTDLLTGTLLGQHAFVYVIIAYLVLKFFLRFKHISMVQQMLFMLLLVVADVLMNYLVAAFISRVPGAEIAWLVPLTSALVWPWLYWLLKECQPKPSIEE